MIRRIDIKCVAVLLSFVARLSLVPYSAFRMKTALYMKICGRKRFKLRIYRFRNDANGWRRFHSLSLSFSARTANNANAKIENVDIDINPRPEQRTHELYANTHTHTHACLYVCARSIFRISKRTRVNKKTLNTIAKDLLYIMARCVCVLCDVSTKCIVSEIVWIIELEPFSQQIRSFIFYYRVPLLAIH